MSPARIPSLGEATRAVSPILDAAAKRVRAADAIRVAEYVVSWAWMADHLGREPTADEHQAALGVSRATYYRRRAAFREAFPNAETPLAVDGARDIARTPVTAPVGALRLA